MRVGQVEKPEPQIHTKQHEAKHLEFRVFGFVSFRG